MVALNPQASEFETIQRQCKTAVVSQLLPDVYRKGNGNEQLAKAVVVAIKGRELGIPMMQAFSQINVIKGKPAISAELMLALIYRAHPKARIDFITLSNTECVIEARRPGGKMTKFAFTIEDAKTAGLLGNSTWSKYPRAMCRSRAITEMARTMFPDSIMGCSYTPEELGAEMNDEGETTTIKDVSSNTPEGEFIEAESNPVDASQEASQETIIEDEPKDVNTKKEPEKKAQGSQKKDYTVNNKQIKRLFAIAYGNDWTNDTIRPAMESLVSKESTKDLNKAEYDFLCDFFENNGPEAMDERDPDPFEGFNEYEQKEYEAPNFAPGV